MTWYSKNVFADQALIIDEDTGDNIAVVYKTEHGPLVASAPELLAACLEAADWLHKTPCSRDEQGSCGVCYAKNILREAIQKAEGQEATQ